MEIAYSKITYKDIVRYREIGYREIASAYPRWLSIQDGHQSKMDVPDLVPHFCASL